LLRKQRKTLGGHFFVAPRRASETQRNQILVLSVQKSLVATKLERRLKQNWGRGWKNALQLIQFSLQYCFQGHPRSMISISSEKAYATSYTA